MDKFVQDQLRLCNCEQLIPLFRDNGYDESRYKSLRISELVELIPNDDDTVHSIFTNIRSHAIKHMKNGSVNPIISVKEDPDGSDDVEIIDVVVNNNLAPVADDVVLNSIVKCEEVELRPSFYNNSNGNESFPLPNMDVESLELEHVEESQESNVGHEQNEHQHEVEQRASGSSSRVLCKRKLQIILQRVPEPLRKRKPRETPQSKIAFLKSTLEACELVRVQVTYDSVEAAGKLHLKFTTLNELEIFIGLLLSLSTEKLTPIKNLYLECTKKTEDDEDNEKEEDNDDSESEEDDGDLLCLIDEPQLQGLASLPPEFLSQLTSIFINCRWNGSINPDTFTKFLSACVNLNHLKLHQGIWGPKGCSVKTIQIPALKKLNILDWVGVFTVGIACYVRSPLPIDIEEQDNFYEPNLCILDFGDNDYPELIEVSLGTPFRMKFSRPSQFPNLTRFQVPSSWDFGFLASPTSTLKQQPWKTVKVITLPTKLLDSEYMHYVPRWFPNLTKVLVCFPSVSGLRALVHHLADMKIQHLSCMVSYVFGSALECALMDEPFVLKSDTDKARFGMLQKYQHWKTFAEHLKIEIPEEAGPNSEAAESEYPVKTIGSFRSLRSLTIKFLTKRIHLPLNEHHWNDPEVQVSKSRWSPKHYPFSEKIFLNELPKLKGKLVEVSVLGLDVKKVAHWQFKRRMGFELCFDDGVAIDYSGRDGFTEDEIRVAGSMVKPEPGS